MGEVGRWIGLGLGVLGAALVAPARRGRPRPARRLDGRTLDMAGREGGRPRPSSQLSLRRVGARGHWNSSQSVPSGELAGLAAGADGGAGIGRRALRVEARRRRPSPSRAASRTAPVPALRLHAERQLHRRAARARATATWTTEKALALAIHDVSRGFIARPGASRIREACRSTSWSRCGSMGPVPSSSGGWRRWATATSRSTIWWRFASTAPASTSSARCSGLGLRRPAADRPGRVPHPRRQPRIRACASASLGYERPGRERAGRRCGSTASRRSSSGS